MNENYITLALLRIYVLYKKSIFCISYVHVLGVFINFFKLESFGAKDFHWRERSL